MTEDQIKNAVKDAIDEKLGHFFIEREQHYQDHQFICSVRTLGDRIKGQACKTSTNISIGAIFTLVLWGIYYFIWKIIMSDKYLK